jgi:hypothetical protein
MRNAVSLIAAVFILAGCSGGGGNIGSSSADPSATPAATSTAPTISGSPATTIQAGHAYLFKASAQDATSSTLKFAIQNVPVWASFDSTTGTLSGTPTAKNVGKTSNILVSVSNGAEDASLPAFSITVSAAPGTPATLTISGQPVTALNAGSAYAFSPTASDPSGAKLTFAIENMPSWATFNKSTGELAGTPEASNVGTYQNIEISVSDGTATASLPAFGISVTQISNGTATVSWLPPTENTNGTPLTNLAGYRIYYGTNAASLTQSVQISNPGLATYVLENLSPATWYFSVVSYSSVNVESPLSQVVSKKITS